MPSDLIEKRLHQLARLSKKLKELKAKGAATADSHATGTPRPDAGPEPGGPGPDEKRQETEPLERLIGSLERRLKAAELELVVYLEEDIPLTGGGRMRLGYDHAPEWGLVYRTATAEGPWQAPRRLLEAPLSIRLGALPFLARLLSVLVVAAEKRLTPSRPHQGS